LNPGRALPCAVTNMGHRQARRGPVGRQLGTNNSWRGDAAAATPPCCRLPWFGRFNAGASLPSCRFGGDRRGPTCCGAARLFCASQNVALTATVSHRLFPWRACHDGPASRLEEYHADEFTVTAQLPMAGAYDLSGRDHRRCPRRSAHAQSYYFAICCRPIRRLPSGRFAGDLLPLPMTPLCPLWTAALRQRRSTPQCRSRHPALSRVSRRLSVRARPPASTALRDNICFGGRLEVRCNCSIVAGMAMSFLPNSQGGL